LSPAVNAAKDSSCMVNIGPSASVKSPCAIVAPNGLAAARSLSTWIHW
jgi:hypothetical protein